MGNTGYKKVLTLRKYINGVSTDDTKVNDKDSEDYVEPIWDPTFCTGQGGQVQTTKPTFTCADANFTIPSGTFGSSTVGLGSVSAGTLRTVLPTEYQLGNFTYRAQIDVPDGYQNSGKVITCESAAIGTTSAQEAVGTLIAVHLTGGVGATCASALNASVSQTVYLKLADLQEVFRGETVNRGVGLGNQAYGSYFDGKWVLDNSSKGAGDYLADTSEYLIYEPTEGIVSEQSVSDTESYVYPFVSTNNGSYMVSKKSLMDPGDGQDPDWYFLAYIAYSVQAQRNTIYFEWCQGNVEGSGGGVGWSDEGTGGGYGVDV